MLILSTKTVRDQQRINYLIAIGFPQKTRERIASLNRLILCYVSIELKSCDLPMRDKQSTLLHLLILVFIVLALAYGQQRANPLNKRDDRAQGVVLKDVPARVDAKASYLFYLHGRIIENKGIRPTDPRYGVYEYEEILNTLAAKGFTVISEARAKDTDVNQYATKVVHQINSLVNAGVPDRKSVV